MRACDRKPCAAWCVSERGVGVFAEEALGACVCAECMLGRGFIDVGVGGCVQ